VLLTENFKCSCVFNRWLIDCPCDFKLKEPPLKDYNACKTYNTAFIIPNSKKTYKKPPHYWDDADSHNAFNPYRMTTEERQKYASNLTTNGTCFPRQKPLHPLGAVDNTTIKFAALEACEQLRRQAPIGDDKMMIPPLLATYERLFNNTGWITSAYWNLTTNRQFAVGVRLTADWTGVRPVNPLTMDFATCKERIYATAQCGLDPNNKEESIGSGVGLFLDADHPVMVEVESRELTVERLKNPQRIFPLRPQDGMGAVETHVFAADRPLPTPFWESHPGNSGREGVWITYIHGPSSSAVEPLPTLVSSSNVSMAESSRPTSTATSRSGLTCKQSSGQSTSRNVY
jgi:hypothetical protein